MRDFFNFTCRFYHGQSRDGPLVLTLASALMAAWLRSRFVHDDIMMEACGDESWHLRSHQGAIRWVYRIWSLSGPRYEVELASIPYWTIILPLALFAAYQILKKSRTNKPT